MRFVAPFLLCFGASFALSAFSLLTYNVAGNGTTDWSTNAPQVQAIGRQLLYWQPDIITFQEIPLTNTFQMTHWLRAYLHGYFLATNSGTDGFLRSVIASRFPIVRSQKWLDSASLTAFGYDGHFTRDLFEAEISLPDYAEHLHVFTTHLKAQSDAASAARRAAEASAISNFFVAVILPTNGHRPYVLTADLNEDINRPPGTTEQPIQRLGNTNTGLFLTTPENPFNGDDRTISIRESLDARFDYILPGGLLFSNIATSQVFRTDLLSPVPPPLLQSDDKTASDHLPVLMVFNNPYGTPFRLESIRVSGGSFSFDWETTSGRQYDVESSPDFKSWTRVATHLAATGPNLTWSTNAAEPLRFFRIL